MITISTKELRNNFPAVAERIQKGEIFLLIHKSVPLAEIKKPQNIKTFTEATEEDILQSAVSDSAEDFLSDEEVNYYLSLK